MHTAWQCLKLDTRDAQLRRAVRKACNWLKRVRSAAVVRFFERHVVELNCAGEISTDSSKASNRCSWRRQRRSNHSASVTRKGDCCDIVGHIRERWVRFFRSLLNSKSDMLDPLRTFFQRSKGSISESPPKKVERLHLRISSKKKVKRLQS